MVFYPLRKLYQNVFYPKTSYLVVQTQKCLIEFLLVGSKEGLITISTHVDGSEAVIKVKQLDLMETIELLDMLTRFGPPSLQTLHGVLKSLLQNTILRASDISFRCCFMEECKQERTWPILNDLNRMVFRREFVKSDTACNLTRNVVLTCRTLAGFRMHRRRYVINRGLSVRSLGDRIGWRSGKS